MDNNVLIALIALVVLLVAYYAYYEKYMKDPKHGDVHHSPAQKHGFAY
jgi:hypothetical protein